MNDLFNYNKQCKDTAGRVKRIYLSKFADYDDSQIIVLNNSISTFPTTTIYEFDINGSYTQSNNISGGAVGWDQELTVNLNKIYNVINPDTFINQKFRVIGETNNGIYLMFGLFNGLDCSLSNNSGEDKAAFNGFALTFTGKEEEAAPITDIDDYNLFDETALFNYNFNFNL